MILIRLIQQKSQRFIFFSDILSDFVTHGLNIYRGSRYPRWFRFIEINLDEWLVHENDNYWLWKKYVSVRSKSKICTIQSWQSL